MRLIRRLVTIGFTLLMIGLVAPAAASAATAPPSGSAPVTVPGDVSVLTATTCGYTCINVIGSGSHVDRVETWINVNPRFNATIVGFLEIRWRAGGVDHFDYTPKVFISNQYAVGKNVNVNVDANTYVCGRVWGWDGVGYYLVAGEDWKCIQTHP